MPGPVCSGTGGPLCSGIGGRFAPEYAPEVSVARNNGFDARTMRVLLEVVEQKQGMFKEQWHEYFA
jgi:hypothetical protein